MKKLILSAALLLFAGFTAPTASAQQSALDIVNAYNAATGYDQATIDRTKGVEMAMTMDVMGMKMPMALFVRIPESKPQIRVEMDMMGAQMLMVVNGDNGWVSIPGQGVSEIPGEEMKQMTGQFSQFDISSMSNTDVFDFELADTKTVNGVVLQGVKITGKAGSPLEQAFQKAEYIGYYNPNTHLMDMMTMHSRETGETISMELKNYKTFGKGTVKLPSLMIVDTPQGEAIAAITKYNYNQDFPDSLFAKPE